MSFYKSKHSNTAVADGKENMPLVDDPSSPPPMTKEDDVCLSSRPPSTQAPPACEPNMEMDHDEYSDSDSRSDDTLSPEENDPYHITTSSSQKRLLEGEMGTIGNEDEDAEQSPIPIQDHAPGNEEDNTIPSSYDDDDDEDGRFSSYDDDPPQESRSRSRYAIPAPSTPRPRPRSPDEDTEMPLSSPTRAEDPTFAYGERDDDDEDAPLSPQSILDHSRDRYEGYSFDEAYDHVPQQDFCSSPRQSYQESWTSSSPHRSDD